MSNGRLYGEPGTLAVAKPAAPATARLADILNRLQAINEHASEFLDRMQGNPSSEKTSGVRPESPPGIANQLSVVEDLCVHLEHQIEAIASMF